jgi:hypothetical protein
MSKKNTVRGQTARLLLIVGVAGLFLLAGLTSRAEELGRCYSAEISDPIVLPDLSVHPPGLLRICFTSEYSPVSGLHKTYVNGNHIGMFMSRRGTSEADEERQPFFLFVRDETNALRLVGYASPDGTALRTYDLSGKGRVKTSWRVAEATSKNDRVLIDATGS